VADIYDQILQPAQYEIGSMWEQNRITVADEHLATAITQHVVARLYEHLEIPIPDKGNALMTGVEGELHQLGANMVADVLEADGWNMRFLGSQLPHRDILSAMEEHEPRLLGISAATLFNLKAVDDLIEDARRRFGQEVKVLVGGGAFRSRPGVWQDVGADGYGRDLREAVSVAAGLVHPN
jgi:methanogenic corrinoid protein MtbC1